jgi:hypothetical protein
MKAFAWFLFFVLVMSETILIPIMELKLSHILREKVFFFTPDMFHHTIYQDVLFVLLWGLVIIMYFVLSLFYIRNILHHSIAIALYSSLLYIVSYRFMYTMYFWEHTILFTSVTLLTLIPFILFYNLSFMNEVRYRKSSKIQKV